MIRVGIFGYGNLGRGVESAIRQNKDMELVAVFTRRSPESVKMLMDHFGGRLKVVLDNGNFPFCGEDASVAYALLKDYVEYMHIKDCDGDGIIVPPGYGNAYLKETLAQINRGVSGDFILTVEPHLMMFTGLSSLSDTDDIKHKYSFADGYEAFEFAVNEIRKMLNELN